MQLAEVAENLYAAPPEDFTTARTEQVAAAKRAGDKDLAKQIGQLRKPTRSAWLVNLLAREAAEELAALLDLGAALREAQRTLDGAELRSLSAQRTKAVDGLTRRAVALGAAAEHPASDAVRQEVAQTLQAALADPEQGELVRRGVVSQAITYGGFGPFDLAAPAPQPRKVAEPEPAPAPDAEPDADLDADQEAQRAAEQAAAEEALRQAQQELAAAQEEAERATAAADVRADQVEELRQQLHEAESAEVAARHQARVLRKRVEELIAAERRASDVAAAAAAED